MRAAVLGAAAAVVLASGFQCAHAAGSPPPPPTPPKCGYCGGPPSPPTPVPTVAPGLVPAPVVVAVHLTPSVRRGHQARLTVAAAGNDAVTAVVHYHHGKPVTYHGKVSASGMYIKVWKVPKTAPLGRATVKVTVRSRLDPYTGTLTFVIAR